MKVDIRDGQALATIDPSAFAAYLRTKGWQEHAEPGGRWATFTYQNFEIALPLTTELRDFVTRIGEAIRTLEVVEDRDQLRIFSDLSSMREVQRFGSSHAPCTAPAETAPEQRLMDYDEFLRANGNKLAGYFMIARLTDNAHLLGIPYPSTLNEQQLETLKEDLRERMPRDSMITDLWDWDVRFEECLGDDWYWHSVFGDDSLVDECSEELADFFLEQCHVYSIDYNQSAEDPDFEALVDEHARKFIQRWRQAVRRFVGCPSK